jgi:oligoendopeptidase F
MFTDTDQWEALFSEVDARIPKYQAFRDRLGKSFETFAACLEFDLALGRDLDKLVTFAHLKNDQDKTDAQGESLFQRAVNLYTRAADAASFIVPQLQALGKDTLSRYAKKERMTQFRVYLQRIIRNIPHTRNAEVEQVLAMAGEALSAPGSIFGQLDNADLSFGSLTDDKGEKKPLTHGNFISFLSSFDRKVRQRAFAQYYEVYEAHKHGIAAALSASVKKDLFLARARHFDTARKAALFKNNIPESVYDTLVTRVRDNLSSHHRYLAFRKKALNLPELRAYDTYVPVVPDVDFHMDYPTAVQTCVEALAPLGKAYCQRLEKGLTRGWVDRYENKGKRSGAYSSGCYDSPPYILMNYDDASINSLFTLIHEAGHSMHSLYSKQGQPYATHNYTIFVAEVASTLNETLLTRHLLDKYDKNPRMTAYILNREIDNIRGTFFRQTMFAEFETIIHAMAAENHPLTLETFTATYRALLDAYFGQKMKIDGALALECLRIPHFYSSFYVYQYATGIAAALGIERRIREKGMPAVENYLTFLGLGGSQFPIQQLKVAGVDMTSPEPVAAAIRHFDTQLDKLEQTWNSLP